MHMEGSIDVDAYSYSCNMILTNLEKYVTASKLSIALLMILF